MTEREVLAAIYALTPKQFEQFVAQLLTTEGYGDVRVQGGPDDRGIDIICRDQDGQLAAVQCKRYAPTATISVMVVQHLVGMTIKRGAHRALLVTTSTFTAPAKKQAADFDVELLDGPTLARKTLQSPGLKDFLNLGASQTQATPKEAQHDHIFHTQVVAKYAQQAEAPATCDLPATSQARARSTEKEVFGFRLAFIAIAGALLLSVLVGAVSINSAPKTGSVFFVIAAMAALMLRTIVSSR